ncbi:MAG: 2-amino-4-hydroxy-6-hydroxymethyldihydropteridine diphosphokinase [Fimbriimonadaceae bacterium]|mgnify:CR=1 FL=1
MTPIGIGLGSNLGDRVGRIQNALDLLSGHVHLRAVSPIYETAPMYVENQPAFLNAAAIGETSMAPLAMLRMLKTVEMEVGRIPAERYGPREIDLDLVAYGCLCYRRMTEPRLEVPHPRTPERRFVLQPLFDIAPELVLPGLPPLADMLAATMEQAAHVRKLEDAVLSIRRG